MQPFERPTRGDESRGKVVEQSWVRRRIAQATEIARRPHQALAKMPAPYAIHDDARRERRRVGHQRLGQFPPTARVLRKTGSVRRRKHFHEAARNEWSVPVGVAPDEHRKILGLTRSIVEVRPRRIGAVEPETGVARGVGNRAREEGRLFQLLEFHFRRGDGRIKRGQFQALCLRGVAILLRVVETKLRVDDLSLNFRGAEDRFDFELLQNEPNPFTNTTQIGYVIPQSGEVTLTLFDLTGKQLLSQTLSGVKGLNKVELTKDQIGAQGMIYYQIQFQGYTATKKMLIL